MGYAVFSYSIATYIITTVWYNIKLYLLEHYTFVLGYLVLMGAMSFGVCYRMGPVENPRTLNLIQWTLQAFALGKKPHNVCYEICVSVFVISFKKFGNLSFSEFCSVL